MKVKVYGQAGCSFCVKAEALLKEMEVEYTYVDIGEDTAAKEYLKASGLTTVPQVFELRDDGYLKRLIGGFTQLEKELLS